MDKKVRSLPWCEGYGRAPHQPGNLVWCSGGSQVQPTSPHRLEPVGSIPNRVNIKAGTGKKKSRNGPPPRSLPIMKSQAFDAGAGCMSQMGKTNGKPGDFIGVYPLGN